MDWKILVAVVVGLLIFGLVQLCSSDEPNYDEQRAREQSTQLGRQEQEKARLAREARAAAEEAVRAARGQRPEAATRTLATDDFRAVLTTRGGALRSFQLLHEQFQELPRDWKTGLRVEDDAELTPVDLVTTNPDYELNAPLRFEVFRGLDGLLPDADFAVVEEDANKVVFRYSQPDQPVSILKKYEIDRDSGPYQLWLTVQVTNTGDERISFLPGVVQTGYQHQSEAAGGMLSKQPNLLQGICRHGETTYHEPWNSGDARVTYTGINAVFTGVETNYFLAAMIPGDDAPATCNVYTTPGGSGDGAWGVVRSELRWGEVELDPGQSRVFKVKSYLGPKNFRVLQSVGHDLELAVDFGWLWPISRVLLFLLLTFQKWVLNWGVAIILLTVLVKVVLLPLTHKSFQSAERMRALKPEIDEITARYKDDPAKKQQETMALYKRSKVNPLGGCLPMLLQMPIWFALFSTLRAAPELYRAGFVGWIADLSSPDPYFITPIVMGALMFVQQQFTPTTGDAMQAKMLKYFMPIMFTAFMLFLPAGLTLYILVNTVLSIAHQYIIHRRRTATEAAVPAGK
jgi:YidC/Oxa1 family membrane protein insertase